MDELNDFDKLAQSAEALGLTRELERILEVPLNVHVELGSKTMRVSELLEVGTGTIIELDSAAGAPLGIYANNTLIAQGEAVVVGERYGAQREQIEDQLIEQFESPAAVASAVTDQRHRGAHRGETCVGLVISRASS